MATLDSLKWALRQKATATAKSPLSDSQYDAGFNILMQGPGRTTYDEFIIPQLSLLLAPVFNSRTCISALEVGPGPQSVLGCLPGYLRRKIKRYAAFEPNDLFATRLEEWLSEVGSPLTDLESPPTIHRSPFDLDRNSKIGISTGTSGGTGKFDLILFCHSMYGMKPKHTFIERALEMLLDRPEGGMVVVFHRDGTLHLDDLTCHRTASFPTGIISVADDDKVLDCFARFIAGFALQDADADNAIRVEWRRVCREFGRREKDHPDHLYFSSPNIMVAFTQHATTLPELTAQVPAVSGDKSPNLARLAPLKLSSDPHNVLAYACPIPKAPKKQKLIVLVTGESCAGKDYCAETWVSAITTCSHQSLRARAVSISDATKREYAAATGADPERLLRDRAYKEQHRPALTRYFQGQVRQRSRLPEEHFLNVVNDAVDVDVLLITGMRDEAPVPAFSHLVPDSRLLEVSVKASRETRQARQDGDDDHVNDNEGILDGKDSNNSPDLIFNNDTIGNEAAKSFSENCLFRFFHEDLQRLADMVPPIPDFPHQGIEFRHVLGISQQSGGLALCTSLLQAHFTGDWAKVSVVVCCETGGFLYASALARCVDIRLALIRQAGKLPPPTISVTKSQSHISSSVATDSREKRIEMGHDVVPRGATVVVVDDVLATGQTLCAVLQLLVEAGIGAKDVNVMVVAEFPIHRGRELLRRRGFGRAKIQSLLVFGGA